MRRYSDYPNPGEERYQRMTSGEQAIWAGIFVNLSTSAEGLVKSLVERTAWASKVAGEVVLAMREHAIASYPQGDELSFLLRSMVNRRKVDDEMDNEIQNAGMWLSHNGFDKTMAAFCLEAGLCRDDEGGA